MIAKNKILLIAIVMLLAAIAEVSVTAYLVEKLGVFNLIAVYIATTAIGLLFVWVNRARKKEMLEVMKNTNWDSFPKNIEEHKIDPRAQYFGTVGLLVGIFFWAVILIVIPGVVTDALGLFILFVWISNSTVRNFDPNYEPKL